MNRLDVLVSHLQRVRAGKEGLRALYVLSSDEALFMMETKDLLRATVKGQGFTERETLMNESGFDWSALMSGSQTLSLFGEKKLLELSIPTGKPGREGAEALKSFAKHVEQLETSDLDTIVCIYLPKLDSATQKSAWFVALEEAGLAVRLDAIERSELPNWIKARLKHNEQEFETGEAGKRSIEFMVEQFEGNLIAAHQEIQKLALLYPKGMLTEEQIRESILNVARYNVFELTETFLVGNMARINRTLDGLKGEGEALVLIVWTLSEEIRLLRTLKEIVLQGGHLASAMKSHRIWGKREQLIPQVLQRMHLPALERALQMIADIDKQSKGIPAKEMPMDPWDGLRRIGGLFAIR